MRIAGPSLALSVLLLAAPAFAQSGGGPTGQNRYELTPPQQGTMQGPMHQGMMQQGMQSGPTSSQMAQSGQSQPGTVTSDTRAKIKQSLEQSGFKNVQVLPQAFLIRAQAPDGSRVVMQVSPDALYGVVLAQPEESSGSSTQPKTSDRTTTHSQ